MPDRRRPQAIQHPAHVVVVSYAPHIAHDCCPRGRRKARKEPPLALRFHQRLHHLASVGRDEIEHGLTVFRQKGIQVNDVSDLLWRAIRDACNDHTGRTVADKNDVPQILVLQHVDDVSDVHFEADLGASEMTPFAESSQRGSEHEVPSLLQQRHDFLPEPRAMPGRVNKDEDFRIHTLRLVGHAHHSDGACPISYAGEHVSTGGSSRARSRAL
jgi:hypothetical protein